MDGIMGGTEFTAREHPALGPGVRVYRFACTHGASSALTLPGRKPLSDLAVLDVLLAAHHQSQRCRCLPTPSMRPLAEARA